MNQSLNAHLEQISRLISGLRDGNVDLKKLSELDKSLDLLSNKIKTSRLDIHSGSLNPFNQGIRQDAVFYFDRKYNIVRFAGAFENIFGRHHQENIPHMSSIMGEDDFEKLKKQTGVLFDTGEPQNFDVKIVSKNGIALPVNVLLEKVVFNGDRDTVAAGMVFLEQTPSDLEDYREILLENLPGIDVYLFDTNFRHVLAGGREKERLKLTNADFTGKTLFEVFDEKTQKRLFPFYRNALDGKVSEGEIRIKKDVFFVSATPVYGIDKQVVGGALISQNVTKEKEVEKNLIKARREAEEADKAKSLFLASMSHEIRTPLNAIIGFSGLLNKTDLSPKQRRFSHLIGQSSEHLLSVVNEVLFLFKLGMGKVFTEQVLFNPRRLVQNVKESLLFRANEKNIKLRYSIDKKVPETMVGDPFRLKQILINLTGNAIKYTDEGEVEIRVYVEKTTTKKVFLRFEVEDTGIGIANEDINNIFEVFTQAGLKNDNTRKGAGLGLTIVKKLVDLLNGRLHVESEPGKGSEFMVVIPFVKPGKDEKIKQEKVYDMDFNLLEGKRVLYADDDENNLLLGKSILSGWKLDYEIARDGAEAYELLQKGKFDVAMLDIHMPKLSGVEVVKKIRNQKENPNYKTKFIAVTANILDKDLEKYLAGGFDDYILKPFREEKIFNKICQLLDVDYRVPTDTGSSGKNNTEVFEDSFNTSQLVAAAGGDVGFFNKMLDTFIQNAQDTAESFIRLAREENWEAIGEKAHKAIPSFRYFNLNELVRGLTRLETLGLHEKNFEPMKPLTKKMSVAIKNIVKEAAQAKIKPRDS